MKAKNKTQKKPTLDLHGFTTDEVFDALDRFVTQHQSRGTKQIRVMTGKGTGKVKAVALDYLKKGHFPWQIERLENGKQNEGVLLVFLDE